MEANETITEAIAAQNAVPAKTTYLLREKLEVTGDGTKDLLALLKGEITSINGLEKVLANGKTATVVVKIVIEMESADLV